MTETHAADVEDDATGETLPEPDDHPDKQVPDHARRRERIQLTLMLGALGVVFGDIGTSPLYSMQTVFAIDGGRVHASPGDVFGVVSLVFWAVTLIVSVKYVVFVMRADNDGEGGVMALAALARRIFEQRRTRWAGVLIGLGVLGAALFYGDSTITPAISVLSAIEGLEVTDSGLSKLTLPLSLVILAALFLLQRFGTHRVGAVFGPIMVVWFLTIGVIGATQIAKHPGILRGLSPQYAGQFIAGHPFTAFVALGAVVLAITGAEALYADMGHFGAVPIRVAWFALVFPALTLNYLAQGALILHDPADRSNPFFLLVPHDLRLPMVILAAAATVIASQAVISGAYSMTRQALRLGFLPHMTIRQTSEEHEGQIYMPAVNWALFVAVLIVTFGFRDSARLATAYGVAVTGTFLITTALLLTLARLRWKWHWWRVALLAVVCGSAEIVFFAANIAKVHEGGWLTLLIAAIVFTVMMTWQRGRQLVTARRTELEGPLPEFLDVVARNGSLRAPGIAVFPHPNPDTTPIALRANYERNHVLHEKILIISSTTATVPHIPWDERLTFTRMDCSAAPMFHVRVEFGFQDVPDFPEVVRRTLAQHFPQRLGNPEEISYFVSKVILARTTRPGLAWWRKRLFIAMAHNAASQAEFLRLPRERTVVLSAEVPV